MAGHPWDLCTKVCLPKMDFRHRFKEWTVVGTCFSTTLSVCLLGNYGKIQTNIKRKKESFVIFSYYYYYYYYYYYFGFKTTRNKTDKSFSQQKVDCMFLITKSYFIFNNLLWFQNLISNWIYCTIFIFSFSLIFLMKQTKINYIIDL